MVVKQTLVGLQIAVPKKTNLQSQARLFGQVLSKAGFDFEFVEYDGFLERGYFFGNGKRQFFFIVGGQP